MEGSRSPVRKSTSPTVRPTVPGLSRACRRESRFRPLMRMTPWVHWARLKVTVATTAKMAVLGPSTAWSRGMPIKPLLAYTVPNRSTARVSSGLERNSRGRGEQNTT